jgi:hypothetical protein
MKHECHMKTKLILKHETLSCGTIKCNVRCSVCIRACTSVGC